MSGQHRRYSPVEMPQAISSKLALSQREMAKPEKVDLLKLYGTSNIPQSTGKKPLKKWLTVGIGAEGEKMM